MAGMSDEEVDEMEDTVCVDTITFCTSRRGKANLFVVVHTDWPCSFILTICLRPFPCTFCF